MKKLIANFRKLPLGYKLLNFSIFILFIIYPLIAMISDAIGHPITK